jgi:hypothetical protein
MSTVTGTADDNGRDRLLPLRESPDESIIGQRAVTERATQPLFEATEWFRHASSDRALGVVDAFTPTATIEERDLCSIE